MSRSSLPIPQLKFNPQDLVTAILEHNLSSGSGQGENDISSMSMTLQEPTSVFEVKAPRTVDEIKNLLESPPAA